MLSYLGPTIGQKAEEYVHLGIELQAYLELRGDPWGWERLDVAAFVGAYPRPDSRIAICCNLAAVLCWLHSWRIDGVDLPALYAALLEVCPADESAHAYIREGGRIARQLAEERSAELLAERRRNAS